MKQFASVLWLFVLAGCAGNSAVKNVAIPEPPPAPREFRGAWVASVANIDWPTKPGLSTKDQQSEILSILDKCRALNINAVIVQVRPAADALYPSKLEPWSYFLTGQQGKAPEPLYDPLKFWCEEGHKRGIEVHAWFNPFRVHPANQKYEDCPESPARKTPNLVRQYGGMLWFDPGEAGARDHSYRVFMDVVKRYDVDGIHIDDYFYPYPVTDPATKKEVPFPDDASWDRYVASGGKLTRNDWRRDNINQLIERIYRGTKQHKKWVKFGISPFGIGRAGRVQGVSGFDQYEKLYADAEKWLREGWLDYWTPQLYWKISATSQPYGPLLGFWVEQNIKHRNVWPGNFTSRLGGEEGANPARKWDAAEIINQIQMTRDTKGASGNVHFSMKALMGNWSGISDALKSGPYAQAALVPASPWLDDKPPGRPSVKAKRKGSIATIYWNPAMFSEKAAVWAVWVRYGSTWKFTVQPGSARSMSVSDDPELGPVTGACVSAVDRCGNESRRMTTVVP